MDIDDHSFVMVEWATDWIPFRRHVVVVKFYLARRWLADGAPIMVHEIDPRAYDNGVIQKKRASR